MKKTNPEVLLCVAHGSEDVETISILDVLRRGDCNVTVGKVLGIEDTEKCTHKDPKLLCKLMMGT